MLDLQGSFCRERRCNHEERRAVQGVNIESMLCLSDQHALYLLHVRKLLQHENHQQWEAKAC